MAHATIRPGDVARTILQHPMRLVVPVVALTLLALVYSLVRPTTWEAAQALIVRDEAGDRLSRPGKFAHSDEMKTSQETIFELARSRGVIWKALEDVGRPACRAASSPWPTNEDLEALQGNVKVVPPKGAEFGKTEVFYLKVKDSDQQRAIDLALAVCRQLQQRFSELREAKAKGTTDELVKSVGLAQADLATATRSLREIEQQAGGDLAELRILNESPSGDSDLRRTTIDLEKELRTLRATQSEGEEFLKLLSSAQDDPAKLLASPGVLLKAQPALGRLKDGLVDAQLRTGQLLGTMSEEHPLVAGGRAAEEAIRNQLHDEISVAIRGVEVDLRVNADRMRDLESQFASRQARFGRLAAVRAEYANLVAAAKNRGDLLKNVEHELAEARASQAAASATSLINLVDTPDAGTRPAGPGRTAIVAAGFGGGWLLGLAIALLSVHPWPLKDDESALSLPFPAAKVIERVKNLNVRGLNLKQALQRVAGRRIPRRRAAGQHV